MGRKFFPSLNGNMTLRRSRDKKIISLTNFDRFDENNEFFKIKAWTIKLKPYKNDEGCNSISTLESSMNRWFL